MIRLKTGLMVCCGFALLACGSEDAKTPEIPETPSMEGAPEAPKTGANKRDMADYDEKLASFINLEKGQDQNYAISLIKATIKSEFTEDVRGTWETYDSGTGLKSFTGFVDNLKDDSVKAQEVHAVFKKGEDGIYRLTEYGARIKCWRGANPDEWTTELCP